MDPAERLPAATKAGIGGTIPTPKPLANRQPSCVETDLNGAAARVAQGDPSAFRPIVEQSSARLYRLAARLLGNTADAEDALQDGYVRAFNALLNQRFDGRSDVRTWLYRIVTNACLDALRQRRSRPTASSETPDASFDGRVSADAKVALRELDEWLGDLPPQQRAVLVLKSVEGFTSAEVAIIMDCSEGAVEQRLVRARGALRKRRRQQR